MYAQVDVILPPPTPPPIHYRYVVLVGMTELNGVGEFAWHEPFLGIGKVMNIPFCGHLTTSISIRVHQPWKLSEISQQNQSLVLA